MGLSLDSLCGEEDDMDKIVHTACVARREPGTDEFQLPHLLADKGGLFLLDVHPQFQCSYTGRTWAFCGKELL